MPGMIDFDKLRRQAVEDRDAGLTPKQGAKRRKWATLKKIGPLPPRRIKPPVRQSPPCTCTPVRHTAKHHKKSGRCKGNCKCQAGIRVTS
jgi:hypothetical protein